MSVLKLTLCVYKNEMYRRLIIHFTFIIFFFSPLCADIIKKISINGNDRLQKDTVILFSGLKINDDVNNDDLNLSIKSLYETDFFQM